VVERLDVMKEFGIPSCPQPIGTRPKLESASFLLVKCQTKLYKMFRKSDKLKVVVDRVVADCTTRRLCEYV
jgi:hypothetical protein